MMPCTAEHFHHPSPLISLVLYALAQNKTPASVNLLAPHEPDQWPALPQGPARRPSGGRGSKIRGALTGGGSGSGSGGSSGGGGGSAVLIGAHRGSLYALPAARVMLDSPGSELALTAVPGAKCTDCSPQSSAGPFGGHMELLGPGGELEDGECRAEDLAVADDDPLPSPDGDADGAEGGLVPLHPDGGAAKEGLGGLTCPHLPLGLYELAEPGLARGSLPWLPASLQGSDEDASWMGWLADNAWQVLLTFLVIALAAAVARLGYLVNMRPAQLQSAALQLAAAGSASVGSTLMAAAAAATGGGSATPARAGKGRKGKSGKGRSAAGAAAPTTASQQTSAELQLQQQQQQPEHKQQQQQQQQDKPVEEEQQQQKQQQQGSSGEAGGLKEPPPQNAPPQQQDGKVSAPSEENGDGARSLSRSDDEARRLSSSDAGFLSSDSGARSYVDETGAVVIGRLRVGPSVLGYGSAGTIVYEGSLDARPVAVKRLLRQFYDLARKEIGVLIVSDEHPNVVRCFAMEEDREFVYLALERCRCALSDWILTPEGQAALAGGCSPPGPSPRAMALLSDVAAGLAALHGRGIVHRDLKPHNVLITDAGRAKLSDMGLSKQLVPEQSSFESGGAGEL
jgi:serine/threonine-protein kinase/endoribonuclease IRE1